MNANFSAHTYLNFICKIILKLCLHKLIEIVMAGSYAVILFLRLFPDYDLSQMCLQRQTQYVTGFVKRGLPHIHIHFTNFDDS